MAFRLILWSVGTLLFVASRSSPRLRAQITRDLTVTIATRDGVARTFLFRNRRVSSRRGVCEGADCMLTFPSASAGTRIFLARNAVGQIVEGLASRDIELRGLPAHVLWFYEMVMAYVPWRRTQYRAMPNPYTAPDPNGKVADRITREPAQDALDPGWSEAGTQREKLNMWQVGKGAPVPGRIENYSHVVDVPTSVGEERP